MTDLQLSPPDHVADRPRLLLERMTLEEKLAQLVGSGRRATARPSPPLQGEFTVEQGLDTATLHGLGT